MRLDEAQHRAKIIELLDGMSQVRMDVWISSGVLAGVLDGETIERVMNEELPRRSHEVQEFWMGPCTMCSMVGHEHPRQVNVFGDPGLN